MNHTLKTKYVAIALGEMKDMIAYPPKIFLDSLLEKYNKIAFRCTVEGEQLLKNEVLSNAIQQKAIHGYDFCRKDGRVEIRRGSKYRIYEFKKSTSKLLAGRIIRGFNLNPKKYNFLK